MLSKKQRRLSKKACEKYQNLSEEEKENKREYDPGQYKNHLENEKQKVKIG